MTPADVDIDDLARQVDDDGVAHSAWDASSHEAFSAELEPGLRDATAYSEQEDLGTLGVVVLDDAPAQTADLRDIAQDVLMSTDVDTIFVKAPGSGAMVSDVHSRSVIESGQPHLLGDPDLVGAIHRFIDHASETGPNWLLLTVLMLAFIAVVVVATAYGSCRARTAVQATEPTVVKAE